MWRQPVKRNGTYPARVWLVVVLVMFCAELAVMLALPLLIPGTGSRLLEAVVDSLLLTGLVSPVLWWTLVQPLQKSAELRSRFLAELFDSIEAERRRIAYELHDGVGQSLTLLVSGLKSLPQNPSPEARTAELQGLAQRALKDVKALALGLRPSLLDDLGLVSAIDRIAADVRENQGLVVQIDSTGLDERRLPEAVETAVFRIIQEALSNIVKHAVATQAFVVLQLEGGWMSCVVQDNGRGFLQSEGGLDSMASGHLGLIGMRERATLLGGHFALHSTPGRGTRVEVRIPLETRPR